MGGLCCLALVQGVQADVGDDVARLEYMPQCLGFATQMPHRCAVEVYGICKGRQELAWNQKPLIPASTAWPAELRQPELKPPGVSAPSMSCTA